MSASKEHLPDRKTSTPTPAGVDSDQDKIKDGDHEKGGDYDSGCSSNYSKEDNEKHTRRRRHHRHHHPPKHGKAEVEVHSSSLSFEELQKKRLCTMEKKMEDEVRKRRKDWEKEVERMHQEFLTLYPADKKWGSDELLDDPRVLRRRGSTDVLDNRRMKTMFLEYPEGGRKFKLRFNMLDCDPKTIKVQADPERISITTVREEEQQDGNIVRREYFRKIEKPREVDFTKVKSYLTKDSILIVEAPVPPTSLDIIKQVAGSPSRSSVDSSRSRSPSNSPRTPIAMQKMGLPHFAGVNGERRMSMVVCIGNCFKPKDVTVQVVTSARILVKAKHEERTSERFSKNKFHKEFELPEKIDTFSVRGGITEDGKLIIGALGKNYDPETKVQASKSISEDISSKATPCNVLDLATFPPTTPTQ